METAGENKENLRGFGKKGKGGKEFEETYGVGVGLFDSFRVCGEGVLDGERPSHEDRLRHKEIRYFGERDGDVHRCPDREDGTHPEF